MNAHPKHPAVAQIAAKIEEHHALERDFQNDQTLKLAEDALEQAKAAAAAVEVDLEDDDTDPEELVDRLLEARLEARRQVEIAEIRLARAQKAVESQGQRVRLPLVEAGRIAAEALLGAVEKFGAALESELRRVIGDADYESESGFYKSQIFRKTQRLHGHARRMESDSSIHSINRAVELLEDATRFR